MTHDKTKTLRVDEPYFAVRDLTKAELDAIEILAVIMPARYAEDEEATGPAAEEDLLATFLENAAQ